jgi:TetR/AcrR family transcriptional repressor of nem operon
MRRSREAKAETHDAIVDKASRLFRERGVEGTSVGDVMAEAGLTHGGFYRHFENKEALVAATVRSAFDGIAQAVEARAEAVGVGAAVADYLDFYLSPEHLAHPGLGCPAPPLAGEIARGSDALKAEFGAGFDRVARVLAEGLPASETSRRELALRELAMRVGAVLIARASHPEIATEVLSACKMPGKLAQTENGEE